MNKYQAMYEAMSAEDKARLDAEVEAEMDRVTEWFNGEIELSEKEWAEIDSLNPGIAADMKARINQNKVTRLEHCLFK